jgi:hypothetical protein
MKEWHRTVVLLIMLIAVIGLIVWLRTGFETQSLNTLR